MRRSLHGAALAAGLAAVAAPAPARADDPGRTAFLAHCAPCHGTEGRGDGPAARWLPVPPRDLVEGAYRWRSTPTGELPTEADVLRTIDHGVPGSAMPPWRGTLPPFVRQALARYVRGLAVAAQGGDDPGAAEVIVAPPGPAPTPELVARGRAVYEALQCATCHGEGGRGDGPAAPGLKDDHGRPLSPWDLTRPAVRSGVGPEAVYRSLMTGLAGTPMPEYGPVVAEADRWPLVLYVMSLRRERGLLGWLLDPLEEQAQ